MADQVADKLHKDPISTKKVPKKFLRSYYDYCSVKVQICAPPKSGHIFRFFFFWGGGFVNMLMRSIPNVSLVFRMI